MTWAWALLGVAHAVMWLVLAVGWVGAALQFWYGWYTSAIAATCVLAAVTVFCGWVTRYACGAWTSALIPYASRHGAYHNVTSPVGGGWVIREQSDD